MKPLLLTISGWGPYKDKAVIEFGEFEDRGLFLITGPTGAGKTTIFDALTYALYGDLSGNMREKNSVRSDFADADTLTFVELAMQHGGTEYLIRRNPEYQRPKKRKTGKDSYTREKENAVLYLPDGAVVEGTAQVNARIQQILVLDYQQFKQISMIAQGEFARLLTASPKDKIRIFREIFGTGIYERFAAGLRKQAAGLYDKVAEQRHKLEEDIRLLMEGLPRAADMGVEQERLVELTGGDSWNYANILSQVEEMKGQTAQLLQEKKAEYSRLDKETHLLTEKVTKQKQDNIRLQELETARERLDLYKGKKAETAIWEKELKKAQNAAFVDSVKVRLEAARDGHKRIEEGLADREAEQKALLKEKEALTGIVQGQADITRYLELSEQCMEKASRAEETGRLLESKEKEWEKAGQSYVEAEKERDRRRGIYEQADRAYKRAAVGIAARLLTDGMPCPVCGSLEHPAPAQAGEEILSEEELQDLKKKYEKAEQNLLIFHGKAAALKTETEGARERKRQILSEAEACGKERKELEDKLAGMPGQASALFLLRDGEAGYPEVLKARSLLQKELARYGQLDGLLQSKEEQSHAAMRERQELADRIKLEETSFKAALKEYGFTGTAEYTRAARSTEERRRLEKEIAGFREGLSGAERLYKHLKEETAGKKSADITALQQLMQERKLYKEDVKAGQEKLHALHADTVRTARALRDKLADMEELSREYGYVKDLDNMASGNNSRKLVFEQYVLAGYFEEILRAANLRFLRMTGGRYEMSRIAEVGDGRIKDNLEIQVLDYYTGKLRSVKTLSGGESFKASLSLALGLSDVIQAMNGGIRVDTLFVDEGFGSLDSESLDQACSALQGLVESNRLIGIISHVPELRERIDAQLIVDKTNCGSKVRIMV